MERAKITINGEVREYPIGTSYASIAKEYQPQYPYDIMLVMEDNRLRELQKTVSGDCTLRFIDATDKLGYNTYRRSMTLLLLKAIYHVGGHENIKKAGIHFAVSKGLYCMVTGNVTVNQEFIDKVKVYMRELVEAALPIEKRSVNTEEAIALFKKYGMEDKEKLFHYRRVSKVNIYSLDGFEDYFYGFMLTNTSYLKYFDLELYEEGFVLRLPSRCNPTELPPFAPQKKIFEVQNSSLEWVRNMGIDTIGDLNDYIVNHDIKELILVQEALLEKKFGEIAEQIAANPKKRLVMIAGPSSSGKTTFSHRLSVQLMAHGLKPHPIAVDDYFVNRDKTPLDKDGKPNYECLEAIDMEQFNKDMTDLLAGKRVELPTFNFKTGLREYKGNYKQLGKEDILVIEGIHCLNDKLSYSLPKENKFKIYISALTQLNIDEHNRIPTTDGRLIRRIVRDARTRGTSAKQTIAMWPSVRRGEEEYIFPFQEEADVMFNSALIYELAALKVYAEPLLFGIGKQEPEYQEAKRLLKFLDYVVGIPSESIPMNSIVREFVGGSILKV